MCYKIVQVSAPLILIKVAHIVFVIPKIDFHRALIIKL